MFVQNLGFPRMHVFGACVCVCACVRARVCVCACVSACFCSRHVIYTIFQTDSDNVIMMHNFIWKYISGLHINATHDSILSKDYLAD